MSATKTYKSHGKVSNSFLAPLVSPHAPPDMKYDPRQRILSEARGVRVKFPISRVEWFPATAEVALLKSHSFQCPELQYQFSKKCPMALVFPASVENSIAAYPQNRPEGPHRPQRLWRFCCCRRHFVEPGTSFRWWGGSKTHTRALEFAQCSSCTRLKDFGGGLA